MDKKKITIAAYSNERVWQLKDTLIYLFNQYADVDVFYLDTNNEDIKADIIIILANNAYEEVKIRVNNNCKIIKGTLTIKKEYINKLKNIPKESNVFVASQNSEYSISISNLLNSLNINNIKFIPMHEIEYQTTQDIDIAVTLGLSKYKPTNAKKIIDIGNLNFDIKTIIEITINLNVLFKINKYRFKEYVEGIINEDTCFEKIYDMAKNLRIRLTSITYWLRRCFFEVDTNQKITTINNVAEKLIMATKKQAIGTHIKKWLPEISINKVLENGLQIKDELIIIKEENYSLSAYPIKNEFEEIIGAYMIVEGLDHMEEQYRNLRGQMLKKGYVAHYTIHNIVGESDSIKNLKKIIANMAISDSSVLITGETGTGKEIAAQALHNLSSRKDKPFIALNCSALPENLLESELFGYEEGAFTGAKKGGRRGVFELANSGTVFLDEIGNMPLNLQAKLLRVVQEREIMPVGSDKIYKIDIRLIAATNRDVNNLIKEGKFMKDLYYRLNVLPIHILPLRQRKEDIPVLFKYFTKLKKLNFQISEEAMQILLYYRWEGNVRELINCIEYLAHLRKDEICVDDLPPNILYYMSSNTEYKVDNPDDENKFLIKYKNDEFMRTILEILEDSYIMRKHIGRKKISEIANKKGIFISEQQTRRYLKILKENEYVHIGKGGTGTSLTLKGKELVKELDK